MFEDEVISEDSDSNYNYFRRNIFKQCVFFSLKTFPIVFTGVTLIITYFLLDAAEVIDLKFEFLMSFLILIKLNITLCYYVCILSFLFIFSFIFKDSDEKKEILLTIYFFFAILSCVFVAILNLWIFDLNRRKEVTINSNTNMCDKDAFEFEVNFLLAWTILSILFFTFLCFPLIFLLVEKEI